MDRSPDVIMKNAPSSRSYTATFCAVRVSFPEVILVSAMPMSPCWVCIPRQKVILWICPGFMLGFAGCNGKNDCCIALPTSFNLACRSSRNSWSPSKMTSSITVYSRYAEIYAWQRVYSIQLHFSRLFALATDSRHSSKTLASC